MDPLSVAASITGIIAVASTTVKIVSRLCYDLGSQPATLLAVSQEISAFAAVLVKVESMMASPASHGSETPTVNLGLILGGCTRTLQRIETIVLDLQYKLSSGPAAKAKMYMSWFGKAKEMAELRNELEKYKATLIIALNVWQNDELYIIALFWLEDLEALT
jgi:hypothetical protein